MISFFRKSTNSEYLALWGEWAFESLGRLSSNRPLPNHDTSSLVDLSVHHSAGKKMRRETVEHSMGNIFRYLAKFVLTSSVSILQFQTTNFPTLGTDPVTTT